MAQSVHGYLVVDEYFRPLSVHWPIGKDLLIDELPLSQYKLLELSDRGNLKYSSELVLESIVIAWKIFLIIENNSELMSIVYFGEVRC